MRAALLALAVACTPADTETGPGTPPRECTLPWPPERPVALGRRWAELPPMAETTALRPAPGGGWLLLQRNGLLWFIDGPDATTASVALDLRARLVLLRDTGATSFALSPTFADDGLLTLIYSAPGPTPFTSRVSRFHRLPGDRLAFDLASEEVVLGLEQYDVDGMHTHGDVAYGPDGALYIGMGDGGPFEDPLGHGQNPFDWWASILRVQPLPGGGYAIPPDNPFADGVAGAPEVWAYGLRNPFRFMFDANGDLWAGDIGHSRLEEVDRILPGRNYGWPVWEGNRCKRPIGCLGGPFEFPVFDYGRRYGSMVVGGTVYHGTRLPDLVGQYVFGDMVSGSLLAYDGTAVHVLAETGVPIIQILEDLDGELLVLSYQGDVFDLVAPEGTFDPDFPTTLAATGCVDPAHPWDAAPDLVPYEINVPFWSDGADKERWVSVPDGTLAIAGDHVALPPGAVAMKRFERGGRFVETRLLARHLDGTWAGYSYGWDALQTGADLAAPEGGISFDWAPAPWTFPSRSQCGQCHNAAAGSALGFEVAQLDRGDQLDAWADAGLLVGLDTADRSHPLPDPSDATPDDRARAWLHANCAICHRPGGPTPAAMDLRWDAALPAMNVCDVLPNDPRDIEGARIVAPGDPDRSVLVRRVEDGSMPPLAHALVDPAGADDVRAWVAGLPGCD